MALDVFLRDPQSRQVAIVDNEGTINVAIQNRPPKNGDAVATPVAFNFANSAGSTDMRVDGSVTPVEFTIDADSTKETYIKTISVLIADNGANLNQFGALAALTNGVDFSYFNIDDGEVLIKGEIQTNLDFIRIGQATAAIGDGTSAFRADTSGASADTYLPLIDLTQTFGLVYGIRLRPGTADKIILRVNDNLTGLDQFDARAFGVQL